MTKNVLITLAVLLAFSFSEAAISKKETALRRPAPVLLGAGSIKGGKAGTGFSILNVQTKIARSKRAERIRFDIGNSAMNPLVGSVSYYNVQNDPKNKKIVVDFSQTLNSRLEQSTLNKLFANSPFVQKSELTFDPVSQTMSLILTTKKPSAIRVKPMPGTNRQTASLTLDIFEPSLVQKGSPRKTARKVR